LTRRGRRINVEERRGGRSSSLYTSGLHKNREMKFLTEANDRKIRLRKDGPGKRKKEGAEEKKEYAR